MSESRIENLRINSQQLLIERMLSLLGDVEVKVTLTDEIPVSASGKYRFTISSVSPFHKKMKV